MSFRNIAVNVKEKVAEHFKGISPDTLKGYFEAIDDSVNDAKESLNGYLGSNISRMLPGKKPYKVGE